MRYLAIRAFVVALAALLLTVLGVAAQSDEPVTVTTTTHVPIVVDVSEATADATSVVTATLIITKEVVMTGGEVISQNVATEIVLPSDASLSVEQSAAPSLAVTVTTVAVPFAATPTSEATAAEETQAAAPVAQANRGANLRGGPGTNYPVVGGVRDGDELQIVAQNDDGSWYKLADGPWIAAFLVDNAPTGLDVAAAPPVPTAAPQPPAAQNAGSNMDQAIADATAAIASNPNDADAYIGRGFAYLQQSNYAKALEDFNRGIALDPQSSVAYFLRGATYQIMGNCGPAVQDLTQAINLGFSGSEVYEARALCYLDLENYIMALPDLVKLLELKPDHPQRSQIESLIQQIRQSL